MILTNSSVAHGLALRGVNNRMSSLTQVGWYWNRLRCMSVAEIVERAGSSASRAVVRRRPARLAAVPAARLEKAGAVWLPKLEPAFHGLALKRADEVLSGQWRVFSRLLGLGFPPEWNRNPDKEVLLPLGDGRRMDVHDAAAFGDIKYLRELNRHRELVVLAQAWQLTGRERYLDGIALLLESWFVQCPNPRGANWSSALEAAIRLINWATVWQLIGGMQSPLFERPVGKVLRIDWLSSVWRHAEFIRGFRSRESNGGHALIGELAGLYVAGATWPLWPEARLWRRAGRDGLEREVLRQCTVDGVHKEQSTGYQQFVWDFLLLAGLAARGSGKPFSTDYWQRMEAMLEYVAGIMDAGGNVPSFGDADDGVVSGLSLGAGGCPFHSQLATGALLFGNPSLARKAGVLDTRTVWLLGADACSRFDTLLLKGAPATRRTDFPEGGVFVLGSRLDTPDEFRVVADAGPLGLGGVAAHGHADALSFTLSVAGRQFLIDPGTGTYHGPAKWRHGFRGSAMHNTLVLGRDDQALSGGRFVWLRRFRTTLLERAGVAASGADRLVAEHDGYRRLPGKPVHRRSWQMDSRGTCLTVQDQVLGSASQSVSLYWHFSEDCNVTCTPDGLIVSNGPIRLGMSLPEGGDVSVLHGSEVPMAGWVSRAYDVIEPSTTVVWRGSVMAGEPLETVFRRL